MNKTIGGLIAGAVAVVAAVTVVVFFVAGSDDDGSIAARGDPPTVGQMQNFLIASTTWCSRPFIASDPTDHSNLEKGRVKRPFFCLAKQFARAIATTMSGSFPTNESRCLC